MNANDVMGGLEKEITKMYGEGHSCAERNVLREAIGMIDRFRIRDTATEPPTRKDAEAVTKICELSDVWEVALVTVQITTEASA